MKKIKTIHNKFIATIIIFGIIISIFSLGLLHYWLFTYFKNTFEDRVISNYTINKKKEKRIENEWILGVTTHRIDVVQAVHGEEVASIIQHQAEIQKTKSELYHEVINGRYLFYNIKLNIKNGETIYEFSIIRDIYAEIFPKIAFCFISAIILMIIISSLATSFMTRHMYTNIKKLREYTKGIGQKDKELDVNFHFQDVELEKLLLDFKVMKETLQREESIRQSTLQYISHEMKTPIMIIDGYISCIKDGLHPRGDLSSSLDVISKQSQRLNQKVKDLITIIKLEAKNLKVDKVVFKLTSLFDEVILNFTPITKKIEINILKNIYLKANRDEFKILIENLISNQIKYSQNYLSITSKIKNGELYLFFFNDGKTISPKIKPLIFSPFIKEYTSGTGLGLSICKTILNRIKGDIYLKETNYGTLFIVKISNKTIYKIFSE